MSTLNVVKNYPVLKSYPMVFNNSILICLIISPLDRIGGCVWENWKKEKEIVTHQQVNSAMLVHDSAFFSSNNFRVMTRISVRFVTYQSGHYNEQITEKRKCYYSHKSDWNVTKLLTFTLSGFQNILFIIGTLTKLYKLRSRQSLVYWFVW